MGNKIGVLNIFFNMRLSSEDDMGHLIALKETKLCRLACKEDAVSRSMKVAIFISSLSDLTEYAPVSASMNAMENNEVTWNHVRMMITEE